MSEELVRQRIKYLIEHGELYPGANRRRYRQVVCALVVVIVLQLAVIAEHILLR